MLHTISAILIFLFASPSLSLLKLKDTRLIVSLKDPLENIEQCVKEGATANINFELQACQQRDGWFDKCLDSRQETLTVSYDSASDTYQLQRDKLGDKLPSQKESINGKIFSWKEVLQTKPTNLLFLTHNKKNFSDKNTFVVKVRALYKCSEDNSMFLAKVFDVLTFGLTKSEEVVVDWTTFKL